MQRPRNKQPRRGGDKPNFNTNRTNNRPPRQQNFNSQSSVPSYASLIPGTAVSIILKADQPTGHQVRGIVSTVLTRGDHPRGVKVRLRDGRVGRVQALVSAEEGARGEEAVGGESAGLGRDGDRGDGDGAGFRGSGRGRRGMVRDVRTEEGGDYLFDETRDGGRSLGDFFSELEERDRRPRNEPATEDTTAGDFESANAVCPVCGIFEGDEAAVAHHVESHFKEEG